MKNILYIFLCYILMVQFSVAQVTEAEYFWNTDPGEGNGETILAVDGNLDQALEKLFADGVSLVMEGLNTFNIRVKDSENTWGPIFTSVVSVEVTLGIAENNVLSNTSVLSPIPVKKLVNLTMSNDYTGDMEITIMDVSGRIVQTSIHNKNTETFSKDLNTSSFSKGIYLVKIDIQNKQTIKRIVK